MFEVFFPRSVTYRVEKRRQLSLQVPAKSALEAETSKSTRATEIHLLHLQAGREVSVSCARDLNLRDLNDTINVTAIHEPINNS